AVRPFNRPERPAYVARLRELAAREPQVEAQMWKMLGFSGFDRGDELSIESLERAGELELREHQPHAAARAPGMLGQVLVRAGYFKRARPLLEESYRIALEEGDEASLADRAGYLAELELAVGNWQAAEGFADECLDFARSAQQRGWEAIAEGHRARIAAHLGREDLTRAAAERSLALIPGRQFFGEHALGALGFLELSLGDYAAAERRLSELDELAGRVGVAEPAAWKYDADLIEALLGLGELGRARVLVERLEERSLPLRSPWSLGVGARCRGLLAAAEGDLEAAS